ncbi:hypothetical protein BsWGS_10223 [Bradybaena similaris]
MQKYDLFTPNWAKPRSAKVSQARPRRRYFHLGSDGVRDRHTYLHFESKPNAANTTVKSTKLNSTTTSICVNKGCQYCLTQSS